MCLGIRIGITALKKSFSSVLDCDLASDDIPVPFIGENIFVFKVSYVGTLNLCFKMPDTEQKTRFQSDHPGLRKCPKTAKHLRKFALLRVHQYVFFLHAVN